MKKTKILLLVAFAMFAISCGSNKSNNQEAQTDQNAEKTECTDSCCKSDSTAKATDTTSCCQKHDENHDCCADCKDVCK